MNIRLVFWSGNEMLWDGQVPVLPPVGAVIDLHGCLNQQEGEFKRVRVVDYRTFALYHGQTVADVEVVAV